MPNLNVNDYIVEGLLVAKCDPSPQRLDELLRLCARTLVEGGPHLVVSEKRATAFMLGSGSLRFLRLRHSVFSPANGYPDSWVSLSIARSDTAERAIVGVGMHLGNTSEQVDVEWETGLEVLRSLTKAIPCELAFLNGRPVDVERSVLPNEKSYAAGGVPALFTPWTYVSGERLRAARLLKSTDLGAYAAASWADGCAIQAVKHLQDAPSEAFLDALSATWSASYLLPLR